MSFYFSDFNISTITDIYDMVNVNAPNYYKTNVFFAGYTTTLTGGERMTSIDVLGNYISKYSTVNNAVSSNLLKTSDSSTQTSFSFSNTDGLHNRITDCPSTVRAWVNFDGYIGGQGTQPAFQTYTWKYNSTTGFITINATYFLEGQKVYIRNVTYANQISINIPDGIYPLAFGTQNDSNGPSTIFYGINAGVNGLSGTLQMAPWCIQGSYNISSITRIGTTDNPVYKILFETPITDINYGVMANGMATNGVAVNVQTSSNVIIGGTDSLKSSNGFIIAATTIIGTTNTDLSYPFLDLSVIVTGNYSI